MAISDLNLTNTASGVLMPGGTSPTAKPFALNEQGRLPVDPSALPQAPIKFTVAELGQQVKQQAPDLLGQFSDEEIGQKILERKPELSAHVIQPEEKSGFFSNLLKGIASPFARLGATALTPFMGGTENRTDVNSAGYDANGNWVGTQEKTGVSLPWLGNIKPIGSDVAQGDVGAGIRDALGTGLELGAYAIGGGAAKDLAGAAIPLKAKLATGLAEGAGIGGTSGLGVGLQNKDATVGSVLGSTAMGAGIGGALGLAFPLAGAAIGKVSEVGGNIANKITGATEKGSALMPKNVDVPTGNVFQRIGKKIETTVIRPTQKDIANGFSINNVAKYDLGGTLEASYNKTIQRLNEYTGKLNELIKSGGDEKIVNMGNLVQQLKNKYSQGGLDRIGTQRAALTTIRNIEKELDLIKPNWRTDPLNLSDAIQAKRAVGQFTAFLHDPLKKGASAEEDVWNSLYMLLKDDTEKQSKNIGIPGLHEVDKAISEIIPIQQAIIRRIPVAERNNILGLSDLIGGTGMFISPGAIAVPLLQRLFKSGEFANYLMKLGENKVPLVSEAATKLAPRKVSPPLKSVRPSASVRPLIKTTVPALMKAKTN